MSAPINRAPFNALIDDNGTGTTGSVWNKAAIQNVVLDPIDLQLSVVGAFPFSLGQGLLISLPGGSYHNIAPGAATVWLFNPAAAITITGIVAEPTGRTHLMVNTTGYPITFPTQDTGSLAGNRFIGPGYTTFTLAVWRSVWILYDYGNWIILQP